MRASIVSLGLECATVFSFVVGGWIGMRFDLLGPFVRSSRSRGLYGIRASSVCGIVRCLRSFFLPVWTTVFELRVLALCAFVGFWELGLLPLSSVVPSDSSRSSPSFLLGIFYGMVLRRSWVGSVGWLRSWVVGVLEGLLRYTAS